MSAIRMSQPSRNISVVRNLRPTLGVANLRQAKPAKAIVSILTVGLLSIALLNLLLQILSSTAVYELADLQHQKKEMDTTAQILGEQVDSLSSQQNLSNSAAKLGMIANTNPVFLSINQQKVLGKPTAALSTENRVARNLIANSAMTEVTTKAELAKVEAAKSPSSSASAQNVVAQKAPASQVVSSGGVIPASPTH